MTDKTVFKKLLIKQAASYPNLQLIDIIKLIYQNEFGSGHMISNENISLKRLLDELEEIKYSVPIKNSFENIGNGLCRLHLAGIKNSGINPETINRFFIHTANTVNGNIKSFEKKLGILRECCNEKLLPFSIDEINNYLDKYKKEGYPAVSHSEIYRKEYLPKYRVVEKEFCNYFEIFCKIDFLTKTKKNISVAIDGNSGAGKSTLAKLLNSIYDCNIIHMDHFFLTPKLRNKTRLNETGGNIDYERFNKEVVKKLKENTEFKYQIYDCKKGKLNNFVLVLPDKITVIEGVYSTHPYFDNPYDLKIFLSVYENIQKYRILKRNGKEMLNRFLTEWIPKENNYFREMKISEKCELIF